MNEPRLGVTPTEIVTSRTIRDIHPIEESDSKLQCRADIKKLVEEPMVPACETLYDLNICTWRSSANFKDLEQGYGVISIDLPSLSEPNKTLAQRFVEEGKAELDDSEDPQLVNLRIPLKETSTVDEVSANALELAKEFRKQKMTWAVRYSLEEMRDWFELPNEAPQEIAQNRNLFYDLETQTFFLNEEQCLKTKEKVKDDR